jgi:predicted acylesterase/phospholipase RssA
MKSLISLATLLLLSDIDHTNLVVADQGQAFDYYFPPGADEDEPHDEHSHEELNLPKLDKCYGLALSDATSLGPYQAGAIIGLLEEFTKRGKPSHSVISGISIGGINAEIYGQHAPGDEQGVIAHLQDFWTKLATQRSKLASSWGWGMVYGFFYEASLYDASDLFSFIADYFKDHSAKRHINIGIANILNG